MSKEELVPLTDQEDFDFNVEDRIVRNTMEPMKKCIAALTRIAERKLWRGRFKSFDDYCKQRTGFSGAYMSRQIKFEEAKRILPMGEIIDNERQYRALVGFRSDLQDQILTEVKAASDNGEKITVGMIERIGRAVQDAHTPQQQETLPASLNEYIDDADDDDDEEEADTPIVVTNEEVLEAVAERTAEVALHPIFRSADHHRLGRKDSKKTVADDMQDESVRAAAEKLRDDLRAEADFLDKLLKKGAA